MQMQWQYWKNDKNYMGLYVNALGRMWARTKELNWNPQASTVWRYHFARDYALQMDLGTEWDFPRKGASNWSGEAQFGLMSQMSSHFMLGVKQAAMLVKGNPRSRFLGTLASVDDRRFYWLFASQMFMGVQFSEQWGGELLYKWYPQSSSRYSAHELFLNLIHYW